MSSLAVAVMIGTCVIVWGGLAALLLRARRQEAAKGLNPEHGSVD